MSFKLESWPSRTYSYTLPMRYRLFAPKLGDAEGFGADDGLVVCLHGYQDHALSMIKRLGWWDANLESEMALPFQVLAVNAPFPVPVRTKAGFIEAYAWYFRDTDRGFTIASPQQTAERVAELLTEIGVAGRPIVIFGFSQGGYLAPFVARHIPNLKSLICLGSGYPPEPYLHLKPTKIYALHGEQDETIPLAASRQAHAALLTTGFQGEFLTLPGLDHRVDPQAEPLVRRCLEKSW